MKLEQSFEVAAPIDRVWDALIDVERVAPCLPGASVTGRNEDGSFAGNLTIKIGPTTAAYAGRLYMEDIDKSAHTATMQAQGTDKRGQGGAKATITSKLSETVNGTHVEVSTDYHITGRLARFGRGGMIEDISNRLLREFATCLQSSLVDKPAAAPEPVVASETSSNAATESAAASTATTEPAGPDEPMSPFPGATPDSGNAIEGIPLMTSVLWERTKRNPVPLALLFGFVLALITLRRRRR